jgi:CRISPR-associated protein Cas4
MLSVTMLSEYLYCERKLFLRKVLGFEEGPSEPTVKGTIRHSVNDKFNKTESEVVSKITRADSFEKVFGNYKDQYYNILKKVVIENKYLIKELKLDAKELFKEMWPFLVYDSLMRAKNVFDFARRNDVYGEELWNQLTPKLLSEMKVTSESLKLKGIVDLIEDHQTHFVPIELKTGKVPREGIWPGHKIQIASYMMLLEEQKPVKEGRIRYLETDESRTVTMNPFIKLEVQELISKVFQLLKNKELPDYAENKRKCASCRLREVCYNDKLVKERLKAV